MSFTKEMNWCWWYHIPSIGGKRFSSLDHAISQLYLLVSNCKNITHTNPHKYRYQWREHICLTHLHFPVTLMKIKGCVNLWFENWNRNAYILHKMKWIQKKKRKRKSKNNLNFEEKWTIIFTIKKNYSFKNKIPSFWH